MARALQYNELVDPDVSWLMVNFEEIHPGFYCIQDEDQPLVFILLYPNLENSPAKISCIPFSLRLEAILFIISLFIIYIYHQIIHS